MEIFLHYFSLEVSERSRSVPSVYQSVHLHLFTHTHIYICNYIKYFNDISLWGTPCSIEKGHSLSFSGYIHPRIKANLMSNILPRVVLCDHLQYKCPSCSLPLTLNTFVNISHLNINIRLHDLLFVNLFSAWRYSWNDSHLTVNKISINQSSSGH
jgi:hypothetical protein